MKKRSLLVHVVLVLVSGLITTAAAQTSTDPLTKKVDQLFAAWDKPDSPGVAIAVTMRRD